MENFHQEFGSDFVHEYLNWIESKNPNEVDLLRSELLEIEALVEQEERRRFIEQEERLFDEILEKVNHERNYRVNWKKEGF